MSDRYDGIDLKRGTTHEPQVRQLQSDLNELGFKIAGEPDGGFGRQTMWAVREFQAYAAMEVVAKEGQTGEAVYADRLRPVVTGAFRYSGPISGVVNAATRGALEHWIENDWRCPVVIEAWSMKNGRRSALRAENIWLHDELKDSKPRIFAKDLSGYFGPADPGDDRVVLGDFVKFLTYCGPRSIPPNHTTAKSELTPEALLGRGLAALTPAQRSTYKVVRAVSEVECMGFFDSVNCYDNAFVSVGPCHWTLGIVDSAGNVAEGELCGFLSYLEFADPEAFRKAFGFFGVKVDEAWVNAQGVPSGVALFNAGARKYAGWVSLQSENGFARLAEAETEGNLFKTWHWFYRFVMAGRTVEGYRRRMWDMARMRIRDLASLPSSDTAGAPRLGDLFTSERAMAIILRWHVRFPAQIANRGRLGPRLQAAIDDAAAARGDLNWAAPTGAWTDAHEAALLEQLRAGAKESGGGLPETISNVDRWPDWVSGANPFSYGLSRDVGPLDIRRRSFNFDSNGLPPSPLG
jgi:hypothetical protein